MRVAFMPPRTRGIPDGIWLREVVVRVVAVVAVVVAGSCAGPGASVGAGENDCAVIAAVAKEHYKFGPDNPPPPLKGLGDAGWRPQCDWSKHGLAFTDYSDTTANTSDDPRAPLKWVAFQKPAYDSNGATIQTEIMHGPLAGMGYECRVHSGFAGWTVGECKVSWVS